MNEEEKESIEWLKKLVKINKRDNLDDTFAEILLNLIEKQSKEIEELFQRNKDLEQIEKEHKEENGRLRDKIKELEEIDLTTVYMDGIYDERDK